MYDYEKSLQDIYCYAVNIMNDIKEFREIYDNKISEATIAKYFELAIMAQQNDLLNAILHKPDSGDN